MPNVEAISTRGFSIGAAAGVTGLDPHTIRAWERRYGAVAPERNARGARRYRDEDLVRLQLLKALVESGEAIGGIARLPDDELRDRLARMSQISGPVAGAETAGRPVLATLAPGVTAQLAADPSTEARVDVALACEELKPFLDALPDCPCDVVVVERHRLGSEPSSALQSIQRASEGSLVVLLYEFATAAELTRLSRSGVRLVRWPLRAAEFLRAIDHYRTLDTAAVALSPPPPSARGAGMAPRVFDDGQLSRLLETSTSVECECPSHLASLVSSVLAFERYSAECESKSEPDALLHRRLAMGSSRIRAELEALLEQVCRHEGLLP
ncbi:MAG: MerR family transcriptional regulator [Myxococcota bacterium]|nr:MerR family transcriptional regulator [Myxococcota bacterium]